MRGRALAQRDATSSSRRPLGRHLVAVLAALGLAAALASPALATPGEGAWHARIVAPGDFGGVVEAGGSLYAIRYPHGSMDLAQVVRVDPSTSRILAWSQTLPSAQLPVLAGHELWVAGLTPFKRQHTQRGVLTELDPRTLRRVLQIPYPGPGIPTTVASTDGLLIGTDVSQGSGCVLRWFDPRSGARLRSEAVGAGVGQCGGAAIDSSGQWLIAVVDGPDGHVTAFRLDAWTGAIGARALLPPVGQAFSMVATPSRIWLASGDPGAFGALLYLATPTLRVLAQSDGLDGARQTLPTFGQFPQLGLSGGRLWIASDGPLGCFAPSSRRALAIVKQGRAPVVPDAIVDVAGRVWGSTGLGDGGPDGLVRLFPPKACD